MSLMMCVFARADTQNSRGVPAQSIRGAIYIQRLSSEHAAINNAINQSINQSIIQCH
jgi:hypothetical protein